MNSVLAAPWRLVILSIKRTTMSILLICQFTRVIQAKDLTLIVIAPNRAHPDRSVVFSIVLQRYELDVWERQHFKARLIQAPGKPDTMTVDAVERTWKVHLTKIESQDLQRSLEEASIPFFRSREREVVSSHRAEITIITSKGEIDCMDRSSKDLRKSDWSRLGTAIKVARKVAHLKLDWTFLFEEIQNESNQARR